MTAIVADASVALKWLVQESDSDIAERILAASTVVHAPFFLRLEVRNGLWKHWRRGLIAPDQIVEAAQSLERTIGFWHEDRSLLEPASQLAISLDHPIYDCIYIALAQRLAAPLITADRKLAGIAPDVAVSPRDWSP